MKKHYMVYLFLMIISTPLVLDIFDINFNIDNNENRELAEKPSFTFEYTKKASSAKQLIYGLYGDILTYKDKYDEYYADNFVLKSPLVKWLSILKSNIFNVSPIPDKVIYGKSNWLFLGDSFSGVIKETLGLSVYSQEELDTIKKHYVEQNKWLNDNGIVYYLAVAPNKDTVYGEYYPITIPETETKLDQVTKMFSNTEINFVVMSSFFEEHKNNEQLYYQTDTHWNDTGAFWGYKALMSQVNQDFPNIKQLEMDDLIQVERYQQGDLSQMLKSDYAEKTFTLQLISPQAMEVEDQLEVPEGYPRLPDQYEMRYVSPANDLKVLMFRDSFSSALVKYISENFGESVFVWSQIDKDLILKEKPDIVIFQIVERDFGIY